MVMGHVLPEKDESLLEAYEKCRRTADPKACCDYALHVGVTWWGPKVLYRSTASPSLSFHCLLPAACNVSFFCFTSTLFWSQRPDVHITFVQRFVVQPERCQSSLTLCLAAGAS